MYNERPVVRGHIVTHGLDKVDGCYWSVWHTVIRPGSELEVANQSCLPVILEGGIILTLVVIGMLILFSESIHSDANQPTRWCDSPS